MSEVRINNLDAWIRQYGTGPRRYFTRRASKADVYAPRRLRQGQEDES
ncbi:hypothetical protein [Exilibacterium tricleocarpae]|nr:hypothetical protein [Exilibacterium tricleocarpae]